MKQFLSQIKLIIARNQTSRRDLNIKYQVNLSVISLSDQAEKINLNISFPLLDNVYLNTVFKSNQSHLKLRKVG